MSHKKGSLIIIEGIDGSGKATQAKLLEKRFLEEGKKTKKIDFPRYYNNFFGKLIGECLAGEHGDFLSLDPYIASTLYACDRFESKKKIDYWIKKGYTVISDRYTISNYLHQGGKIKSKKKRGEFLRWLEKLEFEVFNIQKPDVIIFLDVPLEMSFNLAKEKNNKKEFLKGRRDMHEESLEHLREAKKVISDLTNLKNLEVINCSKSGSLANRKEISEMIWNVIEKIKI